MFEIVCTILGQSLSKSAPCLSITHDHGHSKRCKVNSNWRFREFRVDSDTFDFTIDTDIPVRVDHAPLSGYTTQPTTNTNITGPRPTSVQITTARTNNQQITT